MADTIVKFEAVTRRYGSQEVLTGIDLDLRQGEYLGLVGLNGAGKTTMIKCLLDFIAVDSGDIKIFGMPAAETRSRKNLAYLPEKFTPPYYLTGRDYLEYMARLYEASYNQENIEAMFSVLDLDLAALSKPVRQLSKGMSQKLGLAACLLSGKKLFIMDEPMSGLDPRARAWLKRHLLERKAAHSETIFFSTHLLTDVEVLCDRVAILHEGKIRFAGSPAECCREYGTDNFEQAYLRSID